MAPPVLKSGRHLATCGLLFVLTFLLYAPTLRFGFVAYDDNQYVTDNPVVRQGLTIEGIRWAFTTNHFANWLPITWLSHMLDCELYGLNGGGHHATSALLHALNAVLLLLFLRGATGRPGAALAVAALFAVHPLRAESVVWIAERKDVLAATFFLLTLLAYVRYARAPSAARLSLALALYALGLMSKTMLVTLPGVLLLLDYWPLSRTGLRRLLIEKVPFVVLAGIASAWTVVLQREGAALEGGAHLTATQRLGNALVSVSRYLGKTAWPSDLAVFYPHPGDWPAWKVAAAAALLVAITFVAWFYRRRMPAVLVGWFWFLGMLVPVSGLIQAGEQAMADRYTYLPGIGLVVAAVWAGAALLRKLSPSLNAGATLVGVIVLALAVVTYAQQQHWRDDYHLFAHAAESTEGNWLAHGYVGTELAKRGDADNADYHFREALRINPDHADAHANRANLMLRTGRAPDAIAMYRQAIRLRPNYAEAHNNLGIALANTGDFAAAEREFAAAVQIRPHWPDGLCNWAGALARLGRPDEAAAKYREALQVDAANERARRGLAQLRHAVP